MPLNKKGPEISYEGVSLRLSNTDILQDISFTVEPGSIHCIIGPNGGGKTSLARCLLGQMPHTGKISISWPAGQVVGYVPQSLDFDRTLPITVDDFMGMICQNTPTFMGIGKKHRQAVTSALEKVDVAGKRSRKLGQLSGGERQRVLFAQALIPEPNLLILDEPMTSMDEAGSQTFENIVESLKCKGTTILWIHHDLQQVKRLADTVTCVNREVLFTGPPRDVMTPECILNIFSCKQDTSTASPQ